MDFTDFCDKYRVPYRTKGHHTRSGWVQTDCPFCGPGSGKFHLGYRIAYPYFNCWKCGKHPLRQTLALLFGAPKQLVFDIAKELPRYKPLPNIETTGYFTPPKGVGSLKTAHKKYLRDRDFNPSHLERLWNLGGIGLNGGDHKWTIYIPVKYLGIDCSWTTRSISKSDTGKRYRSAEKHEEKMSIKKLLYGYDLVGHTAIVVEGPSDVWRIGPGAVGMLGKEPTPAQVHRIAQFPKRYVCLDQGAQSEAEKLCESLAHYPGETHNIILDSEDPGSMSKKELRLVRKLLEG